jgi:hypothetical protein
MKFKSIDYDWLVVSGSKAQVSGTGFTRKHGPSHKDDDICDDDAHFVEDREAPFRFLMTAVDGTSTNTPDGLRLKVILTRTGAVIYDNLMGAPDDPDRFTPPPITKGKITVKK